MRARHATTCGICRKQIAPGEEINKLLKKWVHDGCKKAELEARQNAAGAAVEIPLVMPANAPVEYVGERYYRRRGMRVPDLHP